MKAITIRQPWATLIAEGYKEYEFRTWKTKYRGDIFIHAGKGIDKKAMERFKHLGLEYPVGQIIAKATLTDCVYVNEEFAQKMYKKDPIVYKGLLDKGDWDGYGFKLENAEKIKPIEANGKLSLWDCDFECEVEIDSK